MPACPNCGLAFAPPSGPGVPPAPDSGGRRRTGLLAALIVGVVVVVVAAVVAVFVITGGDDEDDGDDGSAGVDDQTTAPSEASSDPASESASGWPSGSDPTTGSSPHDQTITFAAPTGWDENEAVLELWKALLSQQGYTVEVKEISSDVVFPALENGEIDVFLDVWLPRTHRAQWQQLKTHAEDLGAWYRGARNTIVVPKYLKNVRTVGDLRKVAGDLKRTITGVQAGTPLNHTVKTKVLPGYKLDGWSVASQPIETTLDDLDAATKSREPIAVVLWKPHWAYHGMPVRPLRDPKGLLGKPERIHAVARQGFSADHPELAAAMQRFRLDDKKTAELEWLVLRKHQNDPEAGAQEWLANHPGFAAGLGLR